MQDRYIIISSAYNEEEHIVRTIQSVLKQTIKPIEWIIVNDGSTDNTANIVKQYIPNNPWIRLLSVEKTTVDFGTHAVVNFYKGFEKIKNSSWDYIVKLDADLEIDRNDFFEFQLNKFNDWEQLGISSGITYSTHTGEKILTKGRHYWRTGGAMKIYRRKCFEVIGGLKPLYGWDGLDEYQAMYQGWKTRTFFELEVNHLGKVRALDREKKIWLTKAKGKSMYQRGYPLEFVVLNAIKMLYKMGIKYSLEYFRGYIQAKHTHTKRFVTKKEKKFIRKLQYLRILDKLIKRQLL